MNYQNYINILELFCSYRGRDEVFDSYYLDGEMVMVVKVLIMH